MALEKSISRSDNKVKGEFPKSYWRITNIRMENGKFFVEVKGYCDVEARKLDTSESSGPMMPGMSGEINITNKSLNFAEGLLPQATLKTINESSRLKHCVYLYLKSIDEFRNATDIFESGQNIPL